MSKGIVYCLHDKKNGICRIGQTTAGNDNRMLTQCAYYPYELDIFKCYVVDALHAEKYMHREFSEKRLKADWFNITPNDFEVLMQLYKSEIEGKYNGKRLKVVVCYDDTLKNSQDAILKLNKILKNTIEKKHFFIASNVRWPPKSIRNYADQRGIQTSNLDSQDLSEITKIISQANAIIVFWDGVKNPYDHILSSARKSNLRERVIILERKIKKNRSGNSIPTMKLIANS